MRQTQKISRIAARIHLTPSNPSGPTTPPDMVIEISEVGMSAIVAEELNVGEGVIAGIRVITENAS
jgi:hypothetical protein